MYDLITVLQLEHAHQQEMAQQIQQERQSDDQRTTDAHELGQHASLTRQAVGAALVRVGERLQGEPSGAMANSERSR